MSSSESRSCLTRQQLENYSRGVLHGELVANYEEHLSVCARCQSVLIELFEGGYRPDWLSSNLRRAGQQSAESQPEVDNSQLSTLSAANDPTLLGSGAPCAAHQLWQNYVEGAQSAGAQTGACPMPGSIGRYRIERILGDGGFGRVYLAYDEKLKRNVALKVPHLMSGNGHVHWDLMLSEAQTVAALDHPGIVPIYDVANTDDVPLFLVSKLIVGQSLAERMADRTVEPTEAVELVVRVADALDYAHAQGVIHRDIKPQNILLDNDGQVFLADFGLAWRGADDSRAYPTAGTPFYMSPEQLAGNADLIDRRSDIYSLGRVLQEMLSQSRQTQLAPPDHSQSLVSPGQADVSQLQSADRQSLSAMHASQCEVRYADNIPAEVIAVCKKATAPDPAARFAQVEDFRNALRASLNAQLPKRSVRRRYMLAASMAIMVVVAAATITQLVPSRLPHMAVVNTAGDVPNDRRSDLSQDLPNDLPGCVELLLRCPPDVFNSIIERWRDELPQIVALLREHVGERQPSPEASLLDLERRHAAALALLKLGHENDYWSIWQANSDPRPITIQLAQFGRDELTAARFIDRLRTSEAIKPIESLPTNFIARLFKLTYSERRNLLLALATGKGNLSNCCDKEFLNEISKLYQLDADPCVHVIAEKILNSANVPLPKLDDSAQVPVADRGWFINSLGGSMMIINSNPSVPYRFSIASCELRQQEFEQFIQETGHVWAGKRGN